jgi:hypothetical protein
MFLFSVRKEQAGFIFNVVGSTPLLYVVVCCDSRGQEVFSYELSFILVSESACPMAAIS